MMAGVSGLFSEVDMLIRPRAGSPGFRDTERLADADSSQTGAEAAGGRVWIERIVQAPDTHRTIGIGRDPRNDICIFDPAISSYHMSLHFPRVAGEPAHISDLGSTNGIYLKGKRVREHSLVSGQAFVLGRHKLQYLERPAESGGGIEIILIISQLAKAPRESQRQAVALIVQDGSDAGNRIDIAAEGITPIETNNVPRAIIARRGSGYYVSHLWGNQFPRINDQEIGVNGQQLRDGDILQIADSHFKFLAS